MKLAIILLTCNQLHLTKAVMDDLYPRDADTDVYVVDNGGSYKQLYDEYIIRPGENLRWTKGTNLGLQISSNRYDYDGYVLLNDDIRLSPNFLEALANAAEYPNAGLVVPLYDDVYEQQKSEYRGIAGDYVGFPKESEVTVADGTAVLVTKACFDAVGYLDEENFGVYGWGADIEYFYRSRQKGFKNIVTYRAYINHFHQGSARFVEQNWSQSASNEMNRGMMTKYGEGWQQLIGYPNG